MNNITHCLSEEGIIVSTMAKWDKIGSSGDVEDRRGNSGLAIGGGTAVVGIVLLFALNYFGVQVDPAVIDQIIGPSSSQSSQTATPVDDGYRQFAEKVLGSSNDYWQTVTPNYEAPKLVLFRGATQSACGLATSQVGPHYCPLDNTIYLDETFFDTLASLGGSKDDVAQAYVISHEVGHHIQNITGTLARVQNDPNYRRTGENSLSVRLELQADCYAGLWAHSLKNKDIFDPGEINEAIQAAEAVGDDRIQVETQGSINPETWTHGSAADRVDSFNTGYKSGEMRVCNL